MRSHPSWSIGLGRWGGVYVRLHMFFLLFAAFTLLLSWQASAQQRDSTDLLPIAAGSLVILLASVILHESGHYIAALRLGGRGEEIVLGPLGGLRPMRPPLDPFSECLMHLAGPLVNSAVCVAAAAVLFAVQENVGELLSPLSPQNLVEGSPLILLFKLTFWINWVLFLVNLTPAFPFDGGRALRAALTGLWRDASPTRAGNVLALVAKVAAILLLGLAWAWFEPRADNSAVVPVWFCFVLLAIFLFFSAKHEEDRNNEIEYDEPSVGYDFSPGYASLESGATHRADPGGPFRRWLERRRQAKLLRLREIEIEEERRVDAILARLHADGIDCLSEDERALLERVSHRYRQRNSQ